MRTRWLELLLISGTFACTGGSTDNRLDGSVNDAADPSHPDAGDTVPDGAPGPDGTPETDAAMQADAGMSPDAASVVCGMAPTGNWRGTARIQESGSGGYEYVEADVTWMLVMTDGCTDTFRPTGTVRYGYDHSGGSSESQAAVGPSDGSLVIDRTNAIATYTIIGATVPAGRWADHRGSFDGDAFGGWLYNDPPVSHSWSITRADAAFPTPGTSCSEPVTERWQSSTIVEHRQGSADATWTRVRTEGCVDTFAPSGIARSVGPHGTTSGATFVYVPDHGEIQANNAELVIDRSVAPPTFEIRYGSTSWPAMIVYTYPDGHTETESGWGVSTWSDAYQGTYDGDHFSAYVGNGSGWTFTR